MCPDESQQSGLDVRATAGAPSASEHEPVAAEYRPGELAFVDRITELQQQRAWWMATNATNVERAVKAEARADRLRELAMGVHCVHVVAYANCGCPNCVIKREALNA